MVARQNVECVCKKLRVGREGILLELSEILFCLAMIFSNSEEESKRLDIKTRDGDCESSNSSKVRAIDAELSESKTCRLLFCKIDHYYH